MNCPKCGEPAYSMGPDFVCTQCQIRILSDKPDEIRENSVVKRLEAERDALGLRVKVLEKARAETAMNIELVVQDCCGCPCCCGAKRLLVGDDG